MRPSSETGGTQRGSLVSAAAAMYATNLAVALLSLLNVFIVARALGPSGRGEVVLLITIATLTSHLGTFGVHEANANLAGSQPALRRRLATNSIAFALACGALTIAVTGGLMMLFPDLRGSADTVLLAVALGAIPALILRRYFTYLVQADYSFRITNIAWLVGPVTGVAGNGLCALLGVITVATAIAIWVLGQLLGTLVLLWHIHRRDGFARPDARLGGRSLAFGLKTHVARFMTLGNYRVDQWFVGVMAGSRELGLYSVAVAWAEVLFYLSAVLVMVQRPDLVRASPRDAARIAARVFRAAVVLAALMMLTLVIAAPVLCSTVFGEEFAGAADDLRVLALGAFGIMALELLGNALTAQRRPLRTAAAVGVAFVVTLVLDVLLIPRYGGLGAATATTVAWTVGGIVAAIIFTRTLRARALELVPNGSEVPSLLRTMRGRARARAGVAGAPPT